MTICAYGENGNRWFGRGHLLPVGLAHEKQGLSTVIAQVARIPMEAELSTISNVVSGHYAVQPDAHHAHRSGEQDPP